MLAPARQPHPHTTTLSLARGAQPGLLQPLKGPDSDLSLRGSNAHFLGYQKVGWRGWRISYHWRHWTVSLCHKIPLNRPTIVSSLLHSCTLCTLRCAPLPSSSFIFLGDCQRLVQIRISNWENLSPLTLCHQLRSLEASRCTRLRNLVSLTSLTRLVLSDSVMVEDLSPLAGCTNLHHLDISKCSAVSEISALSGLTRLQTLSLMGCR